MLKVTVDKLASKRLEADRKRVRMYKGKGGKVALLVYLIFLII